MLWSLYDSASRCFSFIGIEYHGILSVSPYAIDPSDIPGILAGLICLECECFFNDYVYPVLMYVIQIVAMDGPVSFVVGSLVGIVVSQALESIPQNSLYPYLIR